MLFLDEVHRFNKAQQDTFLPFVEDGTLVFIGATTENPSFELNSALLSRARVYVLKALLPAELKPLIERALADPVRGLGATGHAIDAGRARTAGGSRGRRRAARAQPARCRRRPRGRCAGRTPHHARASRARRRPAGTGASTSAASSSTTRSRRCTSPCATAIPDAALYWLCRMLDGGCDPGFIARRLTRMASEDIGNADPRALTLSLAAWDSYDRLGTPEGELALAQACVFMACSPKSNAVYAAYGAAMKDAKELGTLDVPLHLRNAPTRLMKDLGYGKGYRYAHDEADAIVTGQRHFPDAMEPRNYYDPVPRGLEAKLRETLERIRSRGAGPGGASKGPDDRD